MQDHSCKQRLENPSRLAWLNNNKMGVSTKTYERLLTFNIKGEESIEAWYGRSERGGR